MKMLLKERFFIVMILLSMGCAQRVMPYRGVRNQQGPSYEQTEPAGDILPQSTDKRYGGRKRLQNQPQFEEQQISENRWTGYRKKFGSQERRLQQPRKCRIWVPVEAVEKYENATKIQINEQDQMYLIDICCPGYRRILRSGKYICRPLCENCVNGMCQAPEECICYEGFVRNDNGDCVFACPISCENGKCYLDGTCECDPGYKLDETRKFCRPICSSGCGQNPNHNCTQPEVCGCSKGYQLTDEGCKPTCQPECGLGGICVEFNKCECQHGFTLTEGVCQADCYQKCNQGICYSRNRCICNPGYIYHERSTQCIPQ